MKIGIVISRFNEKLTEHMKQTALEYAKTKQIKVVTVVEVPGVYDLPLAVQRAFRTNAVDGIAALGVVIKGKTDHDQLICNATAHTLQQVSLAARKPVSLGVIGPGATKREAQDRVDEYAKRAIDTLISLAQ